MLVHFMLQESCHHSDNECQHEARDGGVKRASAVAQILVVADTSSDLFAAVQFQCRIATAPERLLRLFLGKGKVFNHYDEQNKP